MAWSVYTDISYTRQPPHAGRHSSPHCTQDDSLHLIAFRVTDSHHLIGFRVTYSHHLIVFRVTDSYHLIAFRVTDTHHLIARRATLIISLHAG